MLVEIRLEMLLEIDASVTSVTTRLAVWAKHLKDSRDTIWIFERARGKGGEINEQRFPIFLFDLLLYFNSPSLLSGLQSKIGPVWNSKAEGKGGEKKNQ